MITWGARVRRLERATREYAKLVGPELVNSDVVHRAQVVRTIYVKNRKDPRLRDFMREHYKAFLNDLDREIGRLRAEKRQTENRSRKKSQTQHARPPLNAEYVLYLVLKREERNEVIGDLLEGYCAVLEHFGKRRANIWYYRQVAGSLWPLLRRAIVKIGAFVWLGRMLRRLIS